MAAKKTPAKPTPTQARKESAETGGGTATKVKTQAKSAPAAKKKGGKKGF